MASLDGQEAARPLSRYPIVRPWTSHIILPESGRFAKSSSLSVCARVAATSRGLARKARTGGEGASETHV